MSREKVHQKNTIMVEGEPVSVGAWNPTPEEMETFLKREVELCRDNITRLASRPGVRTVTVSDTLHSQRTFDLATSTR